MASVFLFASFWLSLHFDFVLLTPTDMVNFDEMHTNTNAQCVCVYTCGGQTMVWDRDRCVGNIYFPPNERNRGECIWRWLYWFRTFACIKETKWFTRELFGIFDLPDANGLRWQFKYPIWEFIQCFAFNHEVHLFDAKIFVKYLISFDFSCVAVKIHRKKAKLE